MITVEEVLNLNYYKKANFTGWTNGMRFLIKREVPKIEVPDGEPQEGAPIFHAWVWPGPLIFDLTPEEKKTDFTAPFTNDGKKEIVDWLNAQYAEHPDHWSHEHKVLRPDAANEP